MMCQDGWRSIRIVCYAKLKSERFWNQFFFLQKMLFCVRTKKLEDAPLISREPSNYNFVFYVNMPQTTTYGGVRHT